MLTCPICQASLERYDNGVKCPAGHSFDRARQGYLNLLPVQHKKSRDPGDNAAMVEARRQFLGAGHYAPLARRLAELAAERAPARWLDIGCGEGYYTAQLAEALPASDGYALDISREAVKAACRRDHLLELRQRLYDEVREYVDDKHLADLPPSLALAHTESLSFRLALDSREARETLLAMTPHGWRVNPQRRERILAEPFEVTVAVRYDWLERQKP